MSRGPLRRPRVQLLGLRHDLKANHICMNWSPTCPQRRLIQMTGSSIAIRHKQYLGKRITSVLNSCKFNQSSSLHESLYTFPSVDSAGIGLTKIKARQVHSPSTAGDRYLVNSIELCLEIELIDNFSDDTEYHEISDEEQRRRTNLGSIMDKLKVLVPTLLQESLPAEILLPEILLRICPSHFERVNAYLPNMKGHVSYYATCKALQLFLTSLVLNPKTRLHLHLIRTSRMPEPNCVYAHTTKIYIRWTTCPEGCWHLSGSANKIPRPSDDEYIDYSTANATLGSHRWSSIDPGKLLDKLDHNWSLTGALANLGKGIVGLRKEEERLERIVSGIFVFELNELNDQIIIHTVEDMDVIERPEEQSELRVC